MLRAYFHLHFAILIFGFTVILGKLINLPEIELVWYRVGLASLGYLVMVRPTKSKLLPWKDMLSLASVGMVLMFHWIAFFASIKYANASIGAVCLSISVLFTALIEPVLNRKTLKWYQIVLSLFVITGIYLIHSFHQVYNLGLIFGLISAFLSALYGILNKRIIHKYDDSTVNLYELGFGFIGLTILMPFYFTFSGQSFAIPTTTDWMYLFILAVVCTNYAYNLAIYALRFIPTFSYVLAFNMEAVYGIVLATLIFGENKNMDLGTVIGGALVLGSVFVYPLFERLQQKKQHQINTQLAEA